MKVKFYKIIAISSFTALIMLITVQACSSEKVDSNTKSTCSIEKPLNSLPNEAYDIKDLGNGWYTFRLNTGIIPGKYLYHKYSGVSRQTECVAKIN